MVTLITSSNGAKFLSYSRNDTVFTKKLLNKQRFKLTPKLTPGFYTKSIPRKGFTPVLSDWIKGLMLILGVTQR